MRLLNSLLISLSFVFSVNAFAQDSVQSALDAGNMTQALSLLDAQSNDENAEVAVAGLCGKAQISIMSGEYDKAIQWLDEASEKLAADKKAKNSGYHVIIPYLHANALRLSGDLAGAKNQIKKARDLVEEVKLAEGWDGIVEYEASLDLDDDNSHARKAAENAISAFHSAKLHREEGYAELRLAELELARDKARRAFVSFDNALKAFRTDGNSQKAVAETQLLIAEKQIQQNEMKAADSRLQMAEKEIEAAGSPAALVAKLADLKRQLVTE